MRMNGRCAAACVLSLFFVFVRTPALNGESVESLKEGSLRMPGDGPGLPSFRVRSSAAGAPSESWATDVPIPGEPVTYSNGGLTVYFVDVGQGDAEYIELPGGQNALIDAGPPNGRLAGFLSRRGVAKIDHLVLTHPHADHYGDLPYVFDNLQVGHFYDTKMDNAGAGDDRVRAKAAAEPGITISYPAPGESLDWGEGVQVKVLSSCPDEQSAQRARDVNACSIVIKLTHGAP